MIESPSQVTALYYDNSAYIMEKSREWRVKNLRYGDGYGIVYNANIRLSPSAIGFYALTARTFDRDTFMSKTVIDQSRRLVLRTWRTGRKA